MRKNFLSTKEKQTLQQSYPLNNVSFSFFYNHIVYVIYFIGPFTLSENEVEKVTMLLTSSLQQKLRP